MGRRSLQKLQGEIAEKTARLKEETGVVPGLVVIVVEIIQPAKSM